MTLPNMTLPTASLPTSAPPAVTGPAGGVPPVASTTDGTSGPALGPALGPPTETLDATAARLRGQVSGALDDPNAPGRARLPETAQPKLPASGLIAGTNQPRTLEPDPTSEQLVDYNATPRPHEAQRQNERGVGPDNGQGYQPAIEQRAPGEAPGSQQRVAPQYATGPTPQYATASHPQGHVVHESTGLPTRIANEEAAEKQWAPLMGTVTMLLVSISANVYLAWVAWESRLRYRELLAEHGSSPLAV
jgi:hypothetical protein